MSIKSRWASRVNFLPYQYHFLKYSSWFNDADITESDMFYPPLAEDSTSPIW